MLSRYDTYSRSSIVHLCPGSLSNARHLIHLLDKYLIRRRMERLILFPGSELDYCLTGHRPKNTICMYRNYFKEYSRLICCLITYNASKFWWNNSWISGNKRAANKCLNQILSTLEFIHQKILAILPTRDGHMKSARAYFMCINWQNSLKNFQSN